MPTRHTPVRGAVLAVLFLATAAAWSGAQETSPVGTSPDAGPGVPPVPVAAAPPSPAASLGPNDLLDVNRVDPEAFQAMAARVPEGQAPRIDGRLDDAAWALAPAQGHFIQREPRFGALSSESTEFRILYDDRTIYFAVWAWDSDPGGIRASELKRDAGLRKGDSIKIVIDTFHDHRNAFYFSTNPLGAYKDAQTVENGRTINYEWNAVWECRTRIDERGWYAEIAVPLSQLRFKGSPGSQVWGLNVCRIIVRKNEDTYWVPFPREWQTLGLSRMSHAGLLVGLQGVDSRRRFELVPFVTPAVERDVGAGTPADADAGYGFDMKVGVTSNLTADLTYRTDFAQVEADQEIVNLSRFSLFLPEKRQFFTESAGIYDFGQVGNSLLGGDFSGDAGLLQVFYSRRIGLDDGREIPIIAGGKVTGRAGAYTVGALNIETDEERLRNDDGTTVAVPRANYTAIRVKRDVLSQSSIGVIALNREGGRGNDYNRTLGFDTGLVLGRAWTLTGIFAKTFTPDLTGEDMAGAVDVAWKTDRFNAGGTYLDVGRHFNAEMGFVPRTDVRRSRAKAAWTPRPGWRGVRQLTFGGSTDYFEDHDGRPDSRIHLLEGKVAFNDSSTLSVSANREFDRLPSPFVLGPIVYPAGSYTWARSSVGYTSNQSRRVYGNVAFERGGYYDGDRDTQRISLNFLLMDTLLFESNYTRNVVTAPGRPTYRTNTINTRISYSFTPDLFVKGFLQYNDSRRLANLNLLFWYVYRPGSDLYIVYNQGWDTDLPEPRGIRTRNQSLTVKVTYWLSR